MYPRPKSKIRAAILALLSAVIPGVFEVRRGLKPLGWFALVVQVGAAITLAWLGLVYLADEAQFYVLVTSDVFLMALQILFIALTVTYLALAASTLSRLRKSSKSGRSQVAISLVLILSLGLQSVITFSAAGYVQSTRDLLNDIFAIPESEAAHAAAAPRLNIMLLGGDAGAGRVGLRTDSISVLSVNKVTGQTAIIGIPRNMQGVKFKTSSPLYKKFPKGYRCAKNQCLLEYIYNYGLANKSLYSAAKYGGKSAGVLAMKDALEGLLGITINHYILIDMGGFEKVIEAVGGVQVCVPKTFVAQDGKTVFRKGCQKMSGSRALLYSRSRYDSNDYNRMRKQRLVQIALIKQIPPLKLVQSFLTVSAQHKGYVKTDFSRDQLGFLIPLAQKASKRTVGTLELSWPAYNMVNPDFPKILRDVARTLSRN